MSLGVLNNLSAVYAENYLSQTNKSLSTVLQQLSSGSRINSGADDAAGLSLVDGLQANQQALAQSKTNALEGVGLLQVADGALTQVNSLLNRAVTLATEASNGTLNTTQDAAANQEYQSILSEISDIGSTTTYNDSQVFGSTTGIVTGDSSLAGESIDSLSIRSLSSSGVGDTSGAVSYAPATPATSATPAIPSNVFYDLSQGATLAQTGDSLSGTSTSLSVQYLSAGVGGVLTPETATIKVGQGTSYGNTVGDLIQAINDMSTTTGLTATLGTAAEAGAQAVAAAEASNAGGGGGGDTGILISGSNVGCAGSAGPGVIATMWVNSGTDALAGSLSLVGSDGQTHGITLGQVGTDTLTNLASTINGLGYGITASLNSDDTEITFLSTDSADSVTATSTITDSYNTTSQTDTINDYIPGVNIGYYTVGNASDTLSGTFTGTDKSGNNFSLTLNNTDNTIATLAAALNVGGADAGLGINALVSGTELSFTKRNGDAHAPWLTPSQSLTETGSFTIVNDVSVNAQVAQGTPGVNDVGDIESDMDDPGLVTGSLEVGLSTTINMDASDTTMAAIVNTINDANAGVTATLLNPVDIVLNSANPSLKVQSTIDTQGDDLMFMGGQGNNSFFSTSVVTGSVSDITANPLTYNSNPFYAGTQDVGEIADAGTPGTSAKAASAATLSYSDSAGQSLSATDLLNQADAEAALSGVSTAIVDVAAQDG